MKTKQISANGLESSATQALPSRRSFLTKAIGSGGLALALGSLPFASNKLMAAVEGPCTACDDDLTDIEILNYALTLEHLENAFYRDGLARFNRGDFNSTKSLKGFRGELRQQIYPYLQLIADHERIHVQTLIAVITSLGGTPVQELCYNFGYSTVEQFLKVAQLLENTGVMAYDGAIALICSPELQTAGATIATVEARHASYLNLLNGDVPFPSAFDEPKTMAQILAAAGGFIVSCP